MTFATGDTTRSPRRHRRMAPAGLAVGASMLLLATACSDDGDDTTTAGGDGQTGDDLTISIQDPADGTQVSTPFDLELDTSVPLGEPDTGRHHVHVFYDGNTGDGEYDLVFEETHSVDRQLDEGEHTVEAVIANADHSLTSATDEVTVTVGGGGAGGADTGTDATDTDTGIDYGY
ncbi:MAG TPA: hypothetical protein VFZ68_13005 [Acidimicrobiales bacterium]